MAQVSPPVCDGEKILLSRSSMGEVWKCTFCDNYIVSLGRITLYLSSIEILFLAEMLIEALEHSALCALNEKEFRVENA